MSIVSIAPATAPTLARLREPAEATPGVHDQPALAGRYPPMRLITCGSVDDGKSTLIGRLLWDTKTVTDDQAASLSRDRRGTQNDLGLPDFALLLDGLQAEREQGITIDVAYRYFSTSTRSYIAADGPGHEQYTRNMATGASTADLAVLLVDVRAGLLRQTRRHLTIAALMGIRQVILAVNKMDLADYSRGAFDAIVAEFKELALSRGLSDITAIPMSALKGENIVSSGAQSMPWYPGPTLIEALDRAAIQSNRSGGFRFPVQRVSRPDETFRGYQGTIAGGAVKPGDRITVLPMGTVANVEKIVTFDLERNAAVSGDAVTLVLDRPLDIARGDMIVGPDSVPMIGTDFEAGLVALSPDSVSPGGTFWLKTAHRRQRVVVTPQRKLDLGTGRLEAADSLAMNDIGTVQLSFDEPAIFDRYETNRTTGAFILIDPVSRNTVAAGMISDATTNKPAGIGDRASKDDTAPVILSMPRDLAEKVMALVGVSERRNEIVVLRGSGDQKP